MASILRSVLGAATTAVTLPMIDAYGAAVTYFLCSILIWIAYGYVFVLEIKYTLTMVSYSVLCHIIKYGDEMRAKIDIGFPAVEDNSKLPNST